jgi:membrane-bound lytic murein transglycosylase B
MFFKGPKVTGNVRWTEHVKRKMRFYRLSERILRKLLREPERIEEGVAPRTIAVMRRAKTKRHSEIWLMYRKIKVRAKIGEGLERKNEKVIIISAWRYPGASPAGRPPIPEEIIRELELEEAFDKRPAV